LPKGDPQESLKRLYRDKIREGEQSGSSDLFTQATRYTFLGENAKALDALDKAYAGRSIMLPLLKTEPAFATLHAQPRFQDLARKLALP
jgi:hypothetical protein